MLREELKKRINRIRLEFKGGVKPLQRPLRTVLIESDWNLKTVSPPTQNGQHKY